MPTMKINPDRLRATFISSESTVDRETKVLRNMVVAQLGPFKSAGRGRFDEQSLREIVAMGNTSEHGLKSRFTHPNMSDDGLGKHLGRVQDFRLGTALDARTNKSVPAVRGDLHFNKTALDTPPSGGKPLGLYVMELAESDPAAISSSLVIRPARFVEDSKGKLVQLSDQEEAPEGVTPLWRPLELHASDIVDTGDAVDSLLSAETIDGLPLSALWRGEELLDSVFDGQSREVIRARLLSFLDRYLDNKFQPLATPRMDAVSARLEAMAKKVAK